MTTIKKYEDKLNDIVKNLGIDNYRNISNNENLYHIKTEAVNTIVPYKSSKPSIKDKALIYIKSSWIYIILTIMCFSIIFVSRPNFLIYKDEKEKEHFNYKRYFFLSFTISIVVCIIYYKFSAKS